jgi:DNA (cytosine-5)-methyltransferase 1
MTLRFLSVCSGIEAASVAWHPLGWRAVAFAETAAFPSRVLAHHYPDTPNWGDLERHQEWPDAAIDVLVGGTPCQSFSVAGLRKGMADPRGNLALVFLGLLDRYRPQWVVWENVPGVLSSNKGRDFGAFLGGLGELGYGFAYRVLDAQFFGVAQRRRRVFVVGHAGGDWRRAAAVLFEPDSLSGHPAPRREAGQGTAPTLSARTRGGGGLGTDFDCDGGLVAFGGNNQAGPIDVATAQTAHGGTGRLDFESETFVVAPSGSPAGRWRESAADIAHALRGEGFDASEDGTGRGTPLVPICFSAKDHGADALHDLSPTLRAGGHDTSHANAGVMPAVAYDMRGREGGAQFEGPHDTANIRAASGGSSRSYVQDAWRVRRLMPVECERLQGFPDGYTRIPVRRYKHKPTLAHFRNYRDLYEPNGDGSWTRFAADGPRYKALGNSMAVPVMAWLGANIAAIDAISQETAA